MAQPTYEQVLDVIAQLEGRKREQETRNDQVEGLEICNRKQTGAHG